jgi:HPt (histidine-containing phosphotransfer) domain-containing protein
MTTSPDPKEYKDSRHTTNLDDTRRLLASLWERSLPVLKDRIAQLDRTVLAARAGTLTPQLRKEAATTAHKLAGSLGMFGYPEGTRFARRLEVHLDHAGPVDPLRLAEDLAAMRATVSL